MSDSEDVPQDFTRFMIQGVKRLEDRLIIRYDGRVFGGVMIDVLADEIVAAICPGAEVIVRYHTAETGHPGQVAHMLLRRPGDGVVNPFDLALLLGNWGPCP